ncbi:MAG: MarR family transcriptional regulator [Gordonia sp. (in: high G+C Gram-positive bacteria)]
MTRTEQPPEAARPAVDPHTAARAEHELITLTRLLRNGARRIYTRHGLTFAEYSLLRLIDDEPGVNAAGLAAAAMIDKSTVSRQLAGLQKRGLVDRSDDPRSPRSQALTLTPDSRAALDAISRDVGVAISRRFTDWPAEDLTRLADLLERFNAAVQTAPTEL